MVISQFTPGSEITVMNALSGTESTPLVSFQRHKDFEKVNMGTKGELLLEWMVPPGMVKGDDGTGGGIIRVPLCVASWV